MVSRLLPLCALGVLTGCGGTGPGSDRLGRNSDVRVVMGVPVAAAFQDLELSVAPFRGSFDDLRSCRLDDPKFCFQNEQLTEERVVVLGFKTRSEAAINPYHVWVQNKSKTVRYPVVVRVFVDGKERVNLSTVIERDSALLAAKVFRNNAGT